MTGSPLLPRDDDDDLLAAEYVTGLLDLPARISVQTRLRNDPAFALRVEGWEANFAALNDSYAEAPAPDLLPQIEARLFPTPARRSPFQGLLGWAATAMAAVAVVAYLALTPIAPSFTATLTADAGNLRYEAVIVQDRLTITRVSGDGAASDRSHELWLIVGDNPPVSLGLLPDDQEVISLPGVAPGVTLAVSEEQAGGSPDGVPHGPIIALGVLVAT